MLFFFLLQQKQNIIMAFKYFLLRLENKSHETDKQIKMTVTLNWWKQNIKYTFLGKTCYSEIWIQQVAI